MAEEMLAGNRKSPVRSELICPFLSPPLLSDHVEFVRFKEGSLLRNLEDADAA
ncbi:hypothetical protein Landi51_09979 [Colletotrichum acutatum]